MALIYQLSTTTVDNYKNQFMIEKSTNVSISMIVSQCGDVYVGEHINGKKVGLGILYYANGDVHIGNWLDNVKNGCGVFIENNTGINYVGKWKNNKMHWRKNQIQFPNGDIYEGDVNNGVVSGEGTMIYKNNETFAYRGGWSNGVWHGKGTINYIDGETYKGEFYKNDRSGHGKCIWPSGVEYEGEWKDDNIHGNGVLDARKLDNKIYFGPWDQGVQQYSGYTMTIV
jgi:hypothetical protein